MSFVLDILKTFAKKYQGALIFLGVIIIISGLLVGVYVALKREMCNCFGSKKDEDEEEGLYDENETDDEFSNLQSTDMSIDDVMIPPDEVPPTCDIPEVVVTESSFVDPNASVEKKKKKNLKSVIRKMKIKKSVRFNNTEKNSLITESVDSGYGALASLAPIKRSESMESFMSGVSTMTTNVEEFGEELSPSRIQVFAQYDPKRWVLTVGAKQAQCLVSTQKDKMYWQVHITLMPFKNERFKSRYKSTSTPIFNQNFDIEKISTQALGQLSVRYRIYGRTGRAGRKKLAGETEVELGMLAQMEDYTLKDWRVLKRRTVKTEKQESQV